MERPRLRVGKDATARHCGRRRSARAEETDFDGAKIPAGIGNASGLQNLVKVMRTRGYGNALIEKFCYKNWLRVLGQTWGSAPTA